MAGGGHGCTVAPYRREDGTFNGWRLRLRKQGGVWSQRRPENWAGKDLSATYKIFIFIARALSDLDNFKAREWHSEMMAEATAWEPTDAYRGRTRGTVAGPLPEPRGVLVAATETTMMLRKVGRK